MKRRTVLAAIASPACWAKEPPDAAHVLSTLTESEIDVTHAALQLAKEIDPQVDSRRCSDTVTGLARRVVLMCQGSSDAEQRVRAMNTVLFLEERYRYDRRPFSRSVEAYYFLSGILERKMGNCVSLPLLYVAVAQRAGYPIYPVEAPDHMFARYRDPAFADANIECTNGGLFVPDANYFKRFAVSEQGLRSGAYMRTMTNREYVGALILMNGNWLLRRGDISRGMDHYAVGLRLYPTCALGHENMMQALRALSKMPGQPTSKLLAEAKLHERRLQELGSVPQENVPRSGSFVQRS